MKKVLFVMAALSAAFLAPQQPVAARVSASQLVKPLAVSYTVASNSKSVGFSVTFTPVGGGTPYMYYMEPGFYNLDNQWQMPDGFYDVTIQPFGTYSAGGNFWLQGNSKPGYPGTLTPIVFTNVQLYAGGGNQLIIN